MKSSNLKNSKPLFFVAFLFLLILIGIAWYFFIPKAENTQSSSSQNLKEDKPTQTSVEKTYLLENYPLETVPLYKMKMISSSKFFVNKDPLNNFGYFGTPVNYYNVVFETEATPSELIQYYRSLMNEVNEELISDEKIEGRIGKYKVSASHYGNNPKNYAYLQVYLPVEEYKPENQYFEKFPKVVEIDSEWTEYESSYGLLNQKGGEEEYTMYFPLVGEDIEIDSLINTYTEKYQNKNDFSYDEKSGLMKWEESGNSIYLTFSKSHKRIYLMIRWSI